MPMSPSAAGICTMSASSSRIFASGVMISILSVAMSVMFARRLRLDAGDVALHVEIALAHVIVLAVEDFLEALDRIRERNLHAGRAGEDFRHAERLAEEALDLA